MNTDKIRRFSGLTNRHITFAIIGGIAFGTFAFTYFKSADMANIRKDYNVAISGMERQCDSYDAILTSDKTKSLIRLTEQTAEIASDISRDITCLDSQYIGNFVANQRLSGAFVLNGREELVCEYTTDRAGYRMWKSDLERESLRKILNQPKKIYCERVSKNGKYYDFAVVSRQDSPGYVCCYRYQDSEIMSLNNASVEKLMVGYETSEKGIMCIAKDDVVLGINSKRPKNGWVSSSVTLSKLKSGSNGHIVRIKSSDGTYVGGTAQYNGYSLFACYPISSVYRRAMRKTAMCICIYALIVMLLIAVKYRYEKRYVLEMQSRAERANEEKAALLRRMSHDVRTPINVIIGMMEIGDRYPKDMKKQQYCRDRVRSASVVLLELVNDILFANKMESDTFRIGKRPFDLRIFLGETYALLDVQARQKGVELNIKPVNAKHFNLVGSPMYLRQIIMNIVSNAIKYTDSGGTVELYCSEDSRDGKTANVTFVCRDTGVGMSEEFQKHMFEPFAQEESGARSEYDGIGLGLMIVKELVQRMNGDIQVYSKKNDGSKFTVSIPFDIADVKSEPAPIERTEQAKEINGAKVLIAEDNRLNAEIAEFMLTDKGAEVVCVQNGEQAYEKWMESEEFEFDIILMDVMMPVMNGLDATRKIRSSGRADASAVPIIAITANAFGDDVSECYEAGMNDCILKPFDAARIEQTVKKYL